MRELEERVGKVERERRDNSFILGIFGSRGSHNFSIVLWRKKSGEAKLCIVFRFNRHNNGRESDQAAERF